MSSDLIICVHDMKQFFERRGINVAMDYISGGIYKFALHKCGIVRAYYFHDRDVDPVYFNSDRRYRAMANACDDILRAFNEYVASQIRIGTDDLKKVTDVVGDIKKAQLNALYGQGAFNDEWMKPVFERAKFVIFPTTTDTTKEKENTMNKQFTKDDLKVGYVVKTRNGTLYMVVPDKSDDLVLIRATNVGAPVYKYRCDLVHVDRDKYHLLKGMDIMEVYDRPDLSYKALDISTDGRKLLWKREEPKEMTLEEVEKALGYPVKIVNK